MYARHHARQRAGNPAGDDDLLWGRMSKTSSLRTRAGSGIECQNSAIVRSTMVLNADLWQQYNGISESAFLEAELHGKSMV